MEKFMFLFVDNPDVAQPESPEAMQDHMQKWFAWVEDLTKKGRYVSGEPLLPEGKIIRGSKKLVTDGPFTESKEIVSGYFVIEAKDLNEATELAKDCPIFELDGTVAVRPVQKIDM